MAAQPVKEFVGKVALVTGSSSGIGQAIALTLARRGASVALCGRDLGRLNAVYQECVKISGGHTDRFITVVGDVTDPKHRAVLLSKTLNKFGKLDILVCNAGGLNMIDGVDTATEAVFDSNMNVNVKAVFFLIQAAVPHLEKTKGNIVVTSSVLATIPLDTLITYSMSKAAVDHMVHCFARGLAPKEIRVNSVNPSFVDTRMIRGGSDEAMAEQRAAVSKAMLLHQPMGNRIVTTQDVADAAVFLTSDQACFITGQNLTVDGGRSLI